MPNTEWSWKKVSENEATAKIVYCVEVSAARLRQNKWKVPPVGPLDSETEVLQNALGALASRLGLKPSVLIKAGIERPYWKSSPQGGRIEVIVDGMLLKPFGPWNWEMASKGEMADYICTSGCPDGMLLWFIKHRPEQALSYFPVPARKALGEAVDLEAQSFLFWAKNLRVTRKNGLFEFRIACPNTLVLGDLLRGGSWYYDRMIVNWGGTFGQMYTRLVNLNRYIVQCESPEQMVKAVESRQGMLWGVVLFAHGGPNGVLSSPKTDASEWRYQTQMMASIRRGGYRLAEIHMMQCFSGFKGKLHISEKYLEYMLFHKPKNNSGDELGLKQILPGATDSKIYDLLWRKFETIFPKKSGFRLEKIVWNGTHYMYTIKVDWAEAWLYLGRRVTTYQGLNFIMLDIFKEQYDGYHFFSPLLPDEHHDWSKSRGN